jgi:hypothetical protein
MHVYRSSQRVAAAIVAASLSATCSSATAPSPTQSMTGTWPLEISAAPSCGNQLPFGYAVAPRGRGSASLVQSGNALTGTLYIGDTPSGTVDGTVESGTIRIRLNLNGRNVGVLKPEDEPCRVVAEGTGTTRGLLIDEVFDADA